MGRAKEGACTAEAELCSSISCDICELYSNGGIARVFGRPKLLEVVHDPEGEIAECWPADESPMLGIYLFRNYARLHNHKRGEWVWKNQQSKLDTHPQVLKKDQCRGGSMLPAIYLTD